jgi:hypothetical protein
MTTTMSELNRKAASRSDRERFRDILAVQRAAHLRDGAPSLTKRRDLKKFKAAMLARRSAIEDAISTDFGHRSRHETASVVRGDAGLPGAEELPPDALGHESEVHTFIESYDRLVKAAYPDGPTSEDYTSIVNDQQYSILVDLIDDARAHRARIIEVGHRPGDATRRPHTLAPTVVLGVTDEMKIAHEEIFGPIHPQHGAHHHG